MENKTNKGKEEKRMLAHQKTGTQRINERCRVRRRTKRKIMSWRNSQIYQTIWIEDNKG